MERAFAPARVPSATDRIEDSQLLMLPFLLFQNRPNDMIISSFDASVPFTALPAVQPAGAEDDRPIPTINLNCFSKQNI